MYRVKIKSSEFKVNSKDELAAALLTVAVCEFKKATGKDPSMDGDASEAHIADWLMAMRLAQGIAEQGAGA